MLFTPSPVTNCHTVSNPLERDVLYGRPLDDNADLAPCVSMRLHASPFQSVPNPTGILTQGPSLKYVTLFSTNFDHTPSVTLCYTSRNPLKYANLGSRKS